MRIFLISEAKSLETNATSSHIMIANLLRGLRKDKAQISFFVICEEILNKEEIVQSFIELADEVYVLKSFYGIATGKYKRMWKMLKSCGTIKKYDQEFREIHLEQKPDLMISHCPSYEAIPYSRALKKIYPDVPFYQYWSDPIALSGITPEAYNYKRWIFSFMEKRAFKYADKIIFGTKTLMDVQKKMYPKFAEKMSYVDVAYGEKEIIQQTTYKQEFLYAGGYYSNIRNILPLCEAVQETEGIALDVYGNGDVSLEGYRGVTSYDRVSPTVMKETEKQYKNVVCILNHSCVQIPGKLFYDMYSDKNILVITDGPYGNEIGEYLKTYKRFHFCENKKEAIITALKQMQNMEHFKDKKYIQENFSPQKVANDLVNGGLL